MSPAYTDSTNFPTAAPLQAIAKTAPGMTPSCPSSTPPAAPWSTAPIWVALGPATLPTPSRWTAVATRMSLDLPTPATSRRWNPSRPSTSDWLTPLSASSTPRAAPCVYSTYLGGGTGQRARLRHRPGRRRQCLRHGQDQFHQLPHREPVPGDVRRVGRRRLRRQARSVWRRCRPTSPPPRRRRRA